MNIRYNRMIRLDRLAEYPGCEELDMVFFYPAGAGKVRIWLQTKAKAPVIRIDDEKFSMEKVCEGTCRCIDYGITERLSGGFGQLRIRGMSRREAQQSILILTTHLDLIPDEGERETQRRLWGIARKDAGYSSLLPSRCEVGSAQTFTCAYTAPAKGLPKGAEIRFCLPLAFSYPQTEHPDEEGYFSPTSPYDRMRPISLEVEKESHEKVQVCYCLENGLTSHERFSVQYHTSHVYLFPTSRWETDPAYWYSRIPPLSVGIRLPGYSDFVTLDPANAHSFETMAGVPEKLTISLPGRIRAGQPMFLKGVFTDRFYNEPEHLHGRLPAVHSDLTLLLENSGTKEEFFLPQLQMESGSRFCAPLPELVPGVYRAKAISREGDIVAVSNPLQVISHGQQIFWGEIHSHTAMSDGTGDYGELYRHARQTGNLDFAAASDHACYHSDNEWQTMQDITNVHHEEGKFVTLVGYEWAGKQVHRNFYTSRDRLKLFRGMYEPTSNLSDVWPAFAQDEQVVGGPHGATAHGLDFSMHDAWTERFVEIYSMWGAGDDYENPLRPVHLTDRAVSVHDLLGQGCRLGFTGGGDCHDGHVGFTAHDGIRNSDLPFTSFFRLRYRCGLTGAVMDSLDRKNLIRSLRERSTYATTGERILLNFSAGKTPMGGDVPAGPICMQMEIHACDDIEEIAVVKNGVVIFSLRDQGMDTTTEYEDGTAQAGDYYYLRVTQKDGNRAWSSPIWVK